MIFFKFFVHVFSFGFLYRDWAPPAEKPCPIDQVTDSLIPFYCIDGPAKGRIIDGNYNRMYFGTGGSEMAEYSKHMYAVAFRVGPFSYQATCNVACSGPVPKQLPREAWVNVVAKAVDPDEVQDG